MPYCSWMFRVCISVIKTQIVSLGFCHFWWMCCIYLVKGIFRLFKQSLPYVKCHRYLNKISEMYWKNLGNSPNISNLQRILLIFVIRCDHAHETLKKLICYEKYNRIFTGNKIISGSTMIILFLLIFQTISFWVINWLSSYDSL